MKRDSHYFETADNLRESDSFIFEDGEVVGKKDNQTLLYRMQIGFAEFMGTATLVFLSCTGCTSGMTGGMGIIPNLQLSLTSGLAVMTAIQIFAHISGAHVNPAVTLCSAIMGQTSLIETPIYVGSQIAGSLVGYALVMAVTPQQHLEVAHGHCVTAPNQDLSVTQAVLVEIIATLLMCLAICASWDPRNSNKTDSIAIRIGLLVVVLNLAIGSYTGASMNPTRSLGPAVWNQNLESHWIYWVGPVTGGAISGLFYRKVFLDANK